MKPRRHPAVVAGAHASPNMSCLYAEMRAARVVLPTRFRHDAHTALTPYSGKREPGRGVRRCNIYVARVDPRGATPDSSWRMPARGMSHFLFQPIASSDLGPQHAPALRGVVPLVTSRNGRPDPRVQHMCCAGGPARGHPGFREGNGPREVLETSDEDNQSIH